MHIRLSTCKLEICFQGVNTVRVDNSNTPGARLPSHAQILRVSIRDQTGHVWKFIVDSWSSVSIVLRLVTIHNNALPASFPALVNPNRVVTHVRERYYFAIHCPVFVGNSVNCLPYFGVRNSCEKTVPAPPAERRSTCLWWQNVDLCNKHYHSLGMEYTLGVWSH